MLFPKVWPKCLLILALYFLVSVNLKAAQISQRTILRGHLPAAISTLSPLARMAGSTPLKLSIHLPLRNQAALTELLAQLYDPASPLYHHYLSPDEFDAQFGPTEQDYQAVIDFATRNGFTITGRHPNRMLLEVSAPATNVETAFQVRMQIYAHPTEPRTFFAPDAEPSVETGVPISFIGGLDNFSRPHPQNLHRAPLKPAAKATPQIIGSGPNGNLAGFDYRAAYVPGTTLTGAGQSIGLVEFDGYYASDITAYESQTGVTNVPLKIVLLDGFNGIPTTGVNSANSEVALDIELAISMAPGLTNVVVFEDSPTTGLFNNVLQAMSTNTISKQFACSWSFPGITSAQRTNMDAYFLKFSAQGQSFFASSGDTGASSGVINAPDDDPYITLVGGTTLATAGPGGPWFSETVWNAQQGPGNNASSGGISTIYSNTVWQSGVNMTTNHGSTSKRNAPDVAMVADNIFIIADNGSEETTGGTSAAAPLWAGFAALVNQQSVALGHATIGFVNPALYHIGTNASFAACFNDITVGNNTNASTTQFFAVPGYDLCTGLGSPSGSSLIIALTQPDNFQITPGRGLVANGPAGGPFNVSSQTLLLTNAGSPVFNWSLGNTSVWLTVSTNKGSLTAGGGATNLTLSINSAAANLLPAGVYTANVWFTNLTSGLGQLRQFTLRVGQELVQDGGFEAGDFTYWSLVGGLSAYTNNFVDFANDTSGADYLPYAGDYFAALGQVANLAYLSQPLPTRPGQYYLLSLWLENYLGATPNQFQVQWNTNAATTNIIFNQVNLGAFTYSNLFFVVQATTNVTTLKFGARNDNDFFALDNVSVLAVPAPVIQSINLVNSLIQLNWIALPGAQYQVQYKTNLLQANWLVLSNGITATTNPMSFTNGVSAGPPRFYRVALLP